jgi:zinc transporter 5/7
MDEYQNQPKKAAFSFNDAIPFLIILLVSKFFKSFGIYLCYDLLKQVHLVQLLFYSLCVASIFYILLQKPFSSSATALNSKSASSGQTPSAKRLNKFQYLRLFKYSLFHTFIKLLWLFGLTQCGPLRTTLIFEQSEFVVLCALKAIFLSQTNPSRSRGVIVLLIATLILFAFDYDDISNKVIKKNLQLKPFFN